LRVLVPTLLAQTEDFTQAEELLMPATPASAATCELAHTASVCHRHGVALWYCDITVEVATTTHFEYVWRATSLRNIEPTAGTAPPHGPGHPIIGFLRRATVKWSQCNRPT
jgi:hypothetical protein